jgi:geranylgeranyl pyrophosphate synthase
MTEAQRIRLKDAFANALHLPATMEPRLRAVLQYVLAHPGSMVRPEIVVEIATAYGLPESSATELAIALEYFHTASLLFDDLPCMDDALERRGTTCAHVQFGEAGAILSALALINRAYSLLWSAAAACAEQHRATALSFVEQQLGVDGLLNGQSLDLHFASLPAHAANTENIAIGKTVSLIRLTLCLPAMLGGADDEELLLLRRIALFWGISYQIVDDMKDTLQDQSASSKTVARDSLLGRPNLVHVLGVGGASQRLVRMIRIGDRCVQRLVRLRPALAFLQTLRGELSAEAQRLLLRAEPVLSEEAPLEVGAAR